MIKSLADRILRSPAPQDGGSTVVDLPDSDPSAVKGWMADLPPIETNSPLQPEPAATPPPKKEKEADGKSDAQPDGTGGTGLPGGAKPAAAAVPKTPDGPAGVKVADEPAKPAAKDADKPEGAAEKKAGDQETAESVKKELEKENWPRTGSQWDDYKKKYGDKFQKAETRHLSEVQAREERIKSLETELGTVREASSKAGELAPEVKAQIDKLTKENEEYSTRLQVLDVTQHPKFQNYFGAKIAEQQELAKRIIGEDKAAVFDKIRSMPDGEYKDSQMDQFLSDLSTVQTARMGTVLNNYETIEQERAREIAKNKEHTTTLTTQQQAKQKEFIAHRDKLINDTVAMLQSEKDGMLIYQKKPGDTAWNQAVEARIAQAKNYLEGGKGMKPDEIVRAAFNAAAMPALLQSYQAVLQEHAGAMSKLQSQVKALSAAQPGSGASTSSGAGGEPAPKPEVRIGQTPSEAMGAFTKGIWQDA